MARSLRYIKTTTYIIILDVMMPMVDGFATLEQIKQDKRLQHCKVIFLSAKNKEKDIEKLALG
jgi:CheY-like chemotaxis protein